MDSILHSPENLRSSAFNDLRKLANRLQLAEGSKEKLAVIKEIQIYVLDAYKNPLYSILTAEEIIAIIAWTLDEQRIYEENCCPYLKKDRTGFYCSGYVSDGFPDVPDAKYSVCDMASVDLWCSDSESCKECCIYKNI